MAVNVSRPRLPRRLAGALPAAQPAPGWAAVIRLRAQPAAVSIARLAVTAVFAYLLALIGPGTSQPVLAPLTALLVVQATSYQTLRSAGRRVLSVVAGVLVAVALSRVMGFTWWSLGILTVAALGAGSMLRLREHILEVPISAMLILSLNHGSAAAGRVVETLIGAGAGLLVGLLLSPVRTQPAQEAVGALSCQMAGLLDEMASGVAHGAAVEQAGRWVSRARALDRDIERVDQALSEAEDSMKLNPRALRFPRTTSRLRTRLETLEHASVTIRGLARCIADESQLSGSTGGGEQTRELLSSTLGRLAAALRAHGRAAAASGPGRPASGRRGAQPAGCAGTAPPPEAVEPHLDEAGQERDRLTAALAASTPAQSLQWPLRGELLAHLDRLRAGLHAGHRAAAEQEGVPHARGRILRAASAVSLPALAGLARRRMTAPRRPNRPTARAARVARPLRHAARGRERAVRRRG